MIILFTGGAELVASNLVRLLIRQEHNVLNIDQPTYQTIIHTIYRTRG